MSIKPAQKPAASDARQRLRALWTDRRPYGKRLAISGCAMLACCFTFLFFGPLEMVAFGKGSFLYTYQDVLLPLVLAAAGCLVMGTLALALLRGRIFNYLVSGVFAVTVCGYLQAAFFNGSLGLLTGDAISWAADKKTLFISLAVWFAVTIAVFFLLYMNRELWRKVVMGVSLLLVVMQLVPATMILTGAYDEARLTDFSSYAFTQQGMYEYSGKQNTLVFVLDRMDYDFIESVLRDDPTFFDEMDGFTSYTNAISATARTRPALAQLLTADTEDAYRMPAETYYDAAWASRDGNLLKALADKGYTTEIYSTMADVFGSPEYTGYVSNVRTEPSPLKQLTVLQKLVALSVYRYGPVMLKPFFWADTYYYNNDVFVDDTSVSNAHDARFAQGIRTSTVDRETGSFKLYHLNGGHPPYTLTEEGTEDLNGTDTKRQTIGCFRILFSAFEKMKELGVYKDACIIITADHGQPVDDQSALKKATRIALFYKPAGSEGTPLERSKAQVSIVNIPATILKTIGASYEQYAPPLDEIGEGDAMERFYYKTATGADGHERTLYKYRVTGDAASMDNWELVETLEIEPGHEFY